MSKTDSADSTVNYQVYRDASTGLTPCGCYHISKQVIKLRGRWVLLLAQPTGRHAASRQAKVLCSRSTLLQVKTLTHTLVTYHFTFSNR